MPPKRRTTKSAESSDDGRVHDRRRANREAANRCRQRRKEGYNKMKQDYLDYDCQNVQIRQEIRDLARMKAQLEQILRNHQCVLESVANNGGSTVDRDATPAQSAATDQERAAPSALGAPPVVHQQDQGQSQEHVALIGAPQTTQPEGALSQGQGQIQEHVALMATAQASSSTAQTTGPDGALNQGQSQTESVVGHHVLLPASFQSQLLDRFAIGGAFGLDQDAEQAQYNSEASTSGGVDDNEDCLDGRYEVSGALNRVGMVTEHSYCQGSDSSTS